jgi:exodeoxyribonuclease VII small subunit
MRKITFEDGIKELEAIIQKLEDETTSLEETIKLFTRGNKLEKHCKQILDNAKFKVEKVIAEDTVTDLDE